MKGAKVRRYWAKEMPHTRFQRNDLILHQKTTWGHSVPVAVVDMRKEAFEALAKKILAEADKRVGEKYGVRGNYFNIEFTKAALSAVLGKGGKP